MQPHFNVKQGVINNHQYLESDIVEQPFFEKMVFLERLGLKSSTRSPFMMILSKYITVKSGFSDIEISENLRFCGYVFWKRPIFNLLLNRIMSLHSKVEKI